MARTKRIKSTTAAASELVVKKNLSGWERSKFNQAEHRKLKKLGLFRDEGKMKAPGDEVVPDPPEGFRVIFSDSIIHGLPVHVHEFLHGLLFVYGIQLHHLTP